MRGCHAWTYQGGTPFGDDHIEHPQGGEVHEQGWVSLLEHGRHHPYIKPQQLKALRVVPRDHTLDYRGQGPKGSGFIPCHHQWGHRSQ